jgi:hypothetical protein
MDVTYKIRADPAHYHALIDRYYRQRPFFLKLPVQFGLLAAFAAWAFITFIIAPIEIKVAIALIMGALVIIGGVGFTKWAIYQRFLARAEFGAEMTVTMSERGLSASGPHAQSNWDWAAYPDAVRYPDGILLMRRGVIRWLPDSALVVGTPEDVIALARSKSVLRELA